jgi:hypothetical protein
VSTRITVNRAPAGRSSHRSSTHRGLRGPATRSSTETPEQAGWPIRVRFAGPVPAPEAGAAPNPVGVRAHVPQPRLAHHFGQIPRGR